MRLSTYLLPLLLLIPAAAGQVEKQPVKQKLHEKVPATMDAAAARASRDRALDWLVRTQKENGCWAEGVIVGLLDSGYSIASFYDWQYAACCLACMALLESDETPPRRLALEKGLHWLAHSRMPERGSDWDNDTVWAALYGSILCVAVQKDGRFADTDLMTAIRRRGKLLLKNLRRNQVPTGGWGYYDDPPYSRRPKWATSFSTALVLPCVKDALALGWLKDTRILKRARTYVLKSRLPNGAYQYDMRPIPRSPAGESIDTVKGSLGRIQVGNWGLRMSGDPSLVPLSKVRRGVSQFLKEHRFLDVARMRPVPHEAYYANAGYFYFFGHYYAALAINMLPEQERQSMHAQLRPHIVKTQRKDGSFCDFLGQGYMVVADTGFAILTLNHGLSAKTSKQK